MTAALAAEAEAEGGEVCPWALLDGIMMFR